MSCEKLYFSPFGTHWGFCTEQRLGAQPWSLCQPLCLMGSRFVPRGSCLEVSGTQEAGEPSCSPHASCHSCRQGLTLTFVGPEIEVTASVRHHKASWQPHTVTQLFKASS